MHGVVSFEDIRDGGVGGGGSFLGLSCEPLTGKTVQGSPPVRAPPQASCTQKQEVPAGEPVPTCTDASVSTAHPKSLAKWKQAPTPTLPKELMSSEILKTRKL